MTTATENDYDRVVSVTVINVTPQQIATRVAAFEPAPFLVSDPEYLAAMGGANQDASVIHGISQWLDNTIISVPEIEAFKRELAEEGHALRPEAASAHPAMWAAPRVTRECVTIRAAWVVVGWGWPVASLP